MNEEGHPRARAVMLLVNYWEYKPAALALRLDELRRQRITHIASFVPWQAAESDITHRLTRLIQLVLETPDRSLHLRLILTPEPGIHYPYSGLPKEFARSPENWALDSGLNPVFMLLPPQIFVLPSLLSPNLSERLEGFLSRMDAMLSDLSRPHSSSALPISLQLSGSFWKYYHPAETRGSRIAPSGDYSPHAGTALRERVEQVVSQREFTEPSTESNPILNRWKSRALEEITRRHFYQHAEETFRARCGKAIKRRSSAQGAKEEAHIEIYAPEADPLLRYPQWARMVQGEGMDFLGLCSLLTASGERVSAVGRKVLPLWIHWTLMGGFGSLSDAERQYLLLQSCLEAAGRGGGVLIDEREWSGLSANFRARYEALSRFFARQELQARVVSYYLVAHLWSDYGSLWDELKKHLGHGVKMVASIGVATREASAQLLVVDPGVILTRELIQHLLAYAHSGKTVVLARSSLMTPAAQRELQQSLQFLSPLEIQIGLSYQVYGLGHGKLVSYTLVEDYLTTGEPLSAWPRFVEALLALALIEPIFQLDQPIIQTLSFDYPQHRLALFLLNPTAQALEVELSFTQEIAVSDLGSFLSRPEPFTQSAEIEFTDSSPSRCYRLLVPALGVLPLAIDGLSFGLNQEGLVAAQMAAITEASVGQVAETELPGYRAEGRIEDLWN